MSDFPQMVFSPVREINSCCFCLCNRYTYIEWCYLCIQFILLSIKRTLNNDSLFFCKHCVWKCYSGSWGFPTPHSWNTKYRTAANISQNFSFMKISSVGFVTHKSLPVFKSLKVIILNCLHYTSSSVIMSLSMFWLRYNLVKKNYSLCLFGIPDPSINKGKWKQWKNSQHLFAYLSAFQFLFFVKYSLCWKLFVTNAKNLKNVRFFPLEPSVVKESLCRRAVKIPLK
jgi:hypothetical protein